MRIYIYVIQLIILLLIFSVSKISAQISDNYPYFESFTSGSKPDGIFTPDEATNSIEFKTKGAVLTPEPAGKNKFGAFILNNHQFDASAGIFVSFEYMMTGGTGGDGLTLFFLDAKATPNIGASGRGIGYTYNRSYNGSVGATDFRKSRAIGLNGAYLGIALDSYGNFKHAFYQGEMRANGIPYSLSGGATGTGRVQAKTDNDVVLRGAKSPTPFRADNTYPGFELGYVGYPVLVQQSTYQNIGHILNTDKDYAYDPNNQWKEGTKSFYIRGGKEFERPDDEGYRKAYIELFPNNESLGGGFYVSVMIEHKEKDSPLRKDTIIDNYLYRESFSYLENAINNSLGDNSSPTETPRASSPVNVLDAKVPDALKIGFAAATGEETDSHTIKNVKLVLPRAAEAYDDFLPDQLQGLTSVFTPLENDLGYTGTISRYQDPCPSCIDPATFRFVLEDGTEVYDDNSNTIEHTVLAIGKWTYNKTTGKLLFQPVPSFKDDKAQIRYNIKGGRGGEYPYNQEPYKSAPAVVAVHYIENPNPSSAIIITNQMVTSRFKNNTNR